MMVWLGQVRSANGIGLKAAYFWLGCFNMGMMSLDDSGRGMRECSLVSHFGDQTWRSGEGGLFVCARAQQVPAAGRAKSATAGCREGGAHVC